MEKSELARSICNIMVVKSDLYGIYVSKFKTLEERVTSRETDLSDILIKF